MLPAYFKVTINGEYINALKNFFEGAFSSNDWRIEIIHIL